jgi:hypothetical protein
VASQRKFLSPQVNDSRKSKGEDCNVLILSIKSHMLPGTGGSHCNPSYSGGRDQEGHGLKAVWANSS